MNNQIVPGELRFLTDQIQKLSQPEFETLYDFACCAGCFDDLPEDDSTPEYILLAKAIVEDEDVAETAAEYIDIGM